MDAKHVPLLRYLNMKNRWVTASELSNQLEISVRSVKNYISEIRELDKTLIQSGRNGYRVNSDKLSKSIEEEQYVVPQTPEERQKYILKRILLSNTTIDIFDLSNEICVSENTIQLYFKKIREKISDYNLLIRIKNSKLSLEGTEKNKRKLLSDILYNEIDSKFLTTNRLQEIFIEFDISLIKNTIESTLKTHRFFINDFALMNLVLHILIQIKRIKSNRILRESKRVIIEEGSKSYYEIVESITSELNKEYDISYGNGEKEELVIMLIGSITNLDYENIDIDSLKDIFGDFFLSLTMDLMKEINKYNEFYNIDFQAFVFFVLHIKNLYLRCENNYSIPNPLSSSIQNNYPLIFDCAISIAHRFQKNTDLFVSEDEISYLALHIGNMIEVQKNKKNRISCVIVSPDYYEMNTKLTDVLLSVFKEEIILHAIVTSEDDLFDIETDIIISTVPLFEFYSIPYIKISPFFSENDKKNVMNMVCSVKREKKRTKFKDNLKLVSKPEFFICDSNLSERNETIHYMCDILKNKNYVQNEFEKEIYERENMANTAFGNIAIPHSMKMNANKTIMFILLSNKGINWGNEKVNIVLLITSNYDERKVFLEVFGCRIKVETAFERG
ncbi:MAG: BglG family transcription antiterminator [Enterococcus avium]